MYLNYYRLKSKPFEINPNPDFLWFGEKHKHVLESLEAGVRQSKRFMLLMGDPGTGKTTLVNALLNKLDNDFIFTPILDPDLDENDFFNMIANRLGIGKKYSTKGAFLNDFGTFIQELQVHKKKVVLIVEEVQSIKPNLLDQVLLLSNIGNVEKPLLTVILVGQKEFSHTLRRHDAIKEQIDSTFNLDPLEEVEIENYINHRLTVSGSKKKIFCTRTMPLIFAYSKGIPRMVNNICNLALLTGYKQKKRTIRPSLMRYCTKNYNFLYDNNNTYDRQIRIKYMALAASIVVLFVFSYLISTNQIDDLSLKSNTLFARVKTQFYGSPSQNLPEQSNLRQSDPSYSSELQTEPTILNVQLTENQPSNDAFYISMKEFEAIHLALKDAKDRVIYLENTIADQKQRITRTDEKFLELKNELNRIKADNEFLREEIIAKNTKIDGLRSLRDQLQRQIDTYQSEIEMNKEAVRELKLHLSNLRKEKDIPESSQADSTIQESLSVKDERVASEPEAPHPAELIDWILEKKSE
ncbi:MAG: AAA family ATPase [Desulfosarcina sp.]|jgi:type II secretory pathway predicted ATPase ExeA